MRREATGRFESTSIGGETVDAFIPDPLPPTLQLDSIRAPLERAILALGRLDGASAHLPDRDLFLYAYIRKEAVLSSQIEGTESTLSDLLLFELEESPGVPLGDVTEVSNYVRAMDHGLKRLRGGFPLSNRLMREIHEILLSRGRGKGKAPGEFRRTQNWIGGTRPGNAQFVPPPPHRVEDAMANLERFLNNETSQASALIKAALAHVQFETIHPFLDGNGRVGRLLITLLLCEEGILSEPLLYLSLFFKQHRREYYDRLDGVRRYGEWEEWVEFFSEGVAETADGAARTARKLQGMAEADRERIEGMGRSAGSASKILNAFLRTPIQTIPKLAGKTRLTLPTVAKGLDVLQELGIVREISGKKRGRIYRYERYLKLLNEGTEPL